MLNDLERSHALHPKRGVRSDVPVRWSWRGSERASYDGEVEVGIFMANGGGH